MFISTETSEPLRMSLEDAMQVVAAFPCCQPRLFWEEVAAKQATQLPALLALMEVTLIPHTFECPAQPYCCWCVAKDLCLAPSQSTLLLSRSRSISHP